MKVGDPLNLTGFLDPVFVIYVLCDNREFNICKTLFITVLGDKNGTSV